MRSMQGGNSPAFACATATTTAPIKGAQPTSGSKPVAAPEVVPPSVSLPPPVPAGGTQRWKETK